MVGEIVVTITRMNRDTDVVVTMIMIRINVFIGLAPASVTSYYYRSTNTL